MYIVIHSIGCLSPKPAWKNCGLFLMTEFLTAMGSRMRDCRRSLSESRSELCALASLRENILFSGLGLSRAKAQRRQGKNNKKGARCNVPLLGSDCAS